VQALRFEAFDDSRLARFLVARAAANPAFAIFLHWWVELLHAVVLPGFAAGFVVQWLAHMSPEKRLLSALLEQKLH
jgi:hypothetical protein